MQMFRNTLLAVWCMLTFSSVITAAHYSSGEKFFFGGLTEPEQAATGVITPGEGFVLVKQDGTITLYERWLKNSRGERVRELKAVFTVRADIRSIIRLIADPERGASWNTRAKSYQVLPAAVPGEWFTYICYEVPWPFDDQDCCLHYSVRQQTGGIAAARGGEEGIGYAEIHFQSVEHSRYPAKKSTTRITGVRGMWQMEQRAGGEVGVSYLISSDKSGNLPRWASDPVVRNNFFSSMSAFKMLAEQ